MKTDTEVTTTVETLFEGPVEYRHRWNGLERVGAKVDRRHEIFFGDAETFSWDLTSVDEDVWQLQDVDSERALWRELGQIWEWLREHAKYDPRGYYQYFLERPGKGWPSMAQYAYVVEDLHEGIEKSFPYGTCFTTAHILATLWHHAGLSSWRQLLVGARHNLTAGRDPRHWYVALYIDGEWIAVDPSGVKHQPWPPWEPAPPPRKALWAHPDNRVDYPHPNQAIPLPGGPDFVPLLGAS